MTDGNNTLESLLKRRYSRRAFLRGGLLLGAVGALSPHIPLSAMSGSEDCASPFGFSEPANGYFENHVLASGYNAQILIRWGDALFPDSATFTPDKQTAKQQARQFGYNNDFTAYLPLPYGKHSSSHGLLFINHEYTNPHLMFPGLTYNTAANNINSEQLAIQMQAHGCTVVEIIRANKQWETVLDSTFSRRITATTPIAISGPAAGNARLKTSADTSGKKVLGTIGNCAGGVTPWGTILSAEENFNGYFSGSTDNMQESRNHKRYGVGNQNRHPWHILDKRFDISREPHEPNRFGWVVEIDPYDPDSIPVKRTALGRFKHESATCALAPDGRLAVYSGDDESFEYIYRFVSKEKYTPDERKANRNLLDDGILSVAKLTEGGELHWLPLIHDQGPLTAEHGFASQADVLIETRRAADLLGATAMDRPEDIEVHPITGEVFISLTNNRARTEPNAANPRTENAYGHIITLTPPDGDHTAATFRWELFMLCGDPAEDSGATYSNGAPNCGWLANPDNFAFDPAGNLWIATDGMPKSKHLSDGLYAVATAGNYKGTPHAFFHAPKGAEVCGPSFTPDGTTLFLAIQHPGDDIGSTFDNPSTRWPDFDPDLPPRPSVIAITKEDGGRIGT